jgi:uncharacterized protein YcgI (DUF1989 family)
VSLKNRTLEKSTLANPGTCWSGKIKKGQFLRVTDIEGGQVADFVSLKQDDPTEFLDCLYTNMANGRWRWHEGATIFTNHMNRMWLIMDDKTGVHFTGGGFCSNDVRRLFLDPDDTKKGCRDYLEDAFSDNGIEPQLLQSTSCFNIFMNVEYNDDGSWPAKPPITKAGDYIEMRAEMDIFWALSVCTWPHVNSGDPSPLRIETYS